MSPYFEPSVAPVLPEDPLNDRLRDLGLSEKLVAQVMAEVFREGYHRACPQSPHFWERLVAKGVSKKFSPV